MTKDASTIGLLFTAKQKFNAQYAVFHYNLRRNSCISAQNKCCAEGALAVEETITFFHRDKMESEL